MNDFDGIMDKKVKVTVMLRPSSIRKLDKFCEKLGTGRGKTLDHLIMQANKIEFFVEVNDEV